MRPQIRCLVLIFQMFVLLLFACGQDANDSIKGYPEHGVFLGTEIENVQINNGNLHIEIPLVKTRGRGSIAYYERLILDTKSTFRFQDFCPSGVPLDHCTSTVKPVEHPSLYVYDNLTPFPGSQNDIVTVGTSCNTGISGSDNTFGQNFRVSFTDPGGTKHRMLPLEVTAHDDPCKLAPIVTKMYAADGSGWSLNIDPNVPGFVISGAVARDGTSPLKDANGNFIANNIGSIPATLTDSIGRAIPRAYLVNDVNGNFQYLAVPYIDSTGTTQIIQITYTTATAQTHLCPYATYDRCTEYTGTVQVPSTILLPNGLSYVFGWAPNGYASPSSLTLPSGGQISWTYGVPDTGGARVASRTVSDGANVGRWSYDYGPAPNPPSTEYPYTTVTANGQDTRYTCTYLNPMLDGEGTPICYISKEEVFSGAVGSTLIKTVQTDYTSAPPYLPIRETVCWIASGLCAKSEKDFDTISLGSVGVQSSTSFGNVIALRQYAYGNSSPGALIYSVQNHYYYQDFPAYLTANLLDRIRYTKILDAAGNQVSSESFEYDTTTIRPTSGIVGHDYANFGSTNTVRGNVTTVSKWRNTDGASLTTTNIYDDLGNLLSSADPMQHTTTFGYDDNWSGSGCVPAGSNTKAFKTSSTNALQQQTVFTFFPCTGFLQSVKDQNDINASRNGTIYSPDLMGRPKQVTYSDGGSVTYDYSDSLADLSSTETTAITSDGLKKIVKNSVDGLGRELTNSVESDPSGTTYIDHQYDAFGRKLSVSNPHRNSSAATDGITQYGYDALGRITDLIQQDGGTVHSDYSAFPAVTVKDEAGHQRRSVTDSLGRLVEVDEPTGNPVQANSYATLQSDSNFVVYNQAGSAVWQSGTAGLNAPNIYMQDDGNLVLYSLRWMAGTYTTPVAGPYPQSSCSIGTYLTPGSFCLQASALHPPGANTFC